MPDRPTKPLLPAFPPGPCFLSYNPDGSRLNVAGSSNYARSYRTGDTGEPDMITELSDSMLAIASGKDYIILGDEDGTVGKWTIPNGDLDSLITRFSLPVRDIVLLKEESWIAVATDEVEVKLVNLNNTLETLKLSDSPKPIKHLSVSNDGRYLCASSTNGTIYMYDLSTLPEQPPLYRTIEAVIPTLETSAAASSRCAWHPDSRAFAVPTSTRDIQVVDTKGDMQRVFTGHHTGDITAVAWSPNGALLASASANELIIWSTKTQQPIRKNTYDKIISLIFHPTDNILCWTNSWGECSIQPNFFLDDQLKLLKGPKTRSPFFHDAPRAATPDSLDELLDDGGDLDDWIDDDDNAGYTNGYTNGHTNGHTNGIVNGNGKRIHHFEQPIAKRIRTHPSFQPSQTPWRGNRRYLALNLLGFVWSVDHDTHRTVTVEFFDREMHRDFHFTDYFGYDMACLTEHGALFAAPAKDDGGVIFYRPHETWVARSDIRLQLPPDEEATSIALGKRYIIATTNTGYVRVWTLFGTPVRVWRVKNGPSVTCAAWEDFVITIGNAAGIDDCKLVYSIEDLRSDEVFQSEDVVACEQLQSVFWSDEGNPCIYDRNGVLLTLMHWRTPGQAKWMPLLDTRRLERLRDGKKEETYWPVAVAGDKFHCVILKGGETSPYFPRPLLSEFDFEVPVGRIIEGEDDDGNESNARAGARLEEKFVRSTMLLDLLRDAVDAQGDSAGYTLKTELARREIEVDKVLLQLLAVECREGEERGMKALEVVKLMRDRSGKMLEAAGKVAQRWGQDVLEEKIREVAERRLGGVEEL